MTTKEKSYIEGCHDGIKHAIKEIETMKNYYELAGYNFPTHFENPFDKIIKKLRDLITPSRGLIA